MPGPALSAPRGQSSFSTESSAPLWPGLSSLLSLLPRPLPLLSSLGNLLLDGDPRLHHLFSSSRPPLLRPAPLGGPSAPFPPASVAPMSPSTLARPVPDSLGIHLPPCRLRGASPKRGLSWKDGKAGAGGLRGEALAASECLRVPMGTDAPLSFQISWARRSVGTPLLTGDQGEPPTPPILYEGISRFPQGVDPLNAFPGRLRVADGNFPRGRKRGKPDWSISRWPVDYFFFPPSQVEQCKREAESKGTSFRLAWKNESPHELPGQEQTRANLHVPILPLSA